MSEEKVNRSKLLQVRLTPKELTIVRNKYSVSTSKKLSDYIRKVILDKPVTIYTRNQSLDDFMTEMIALRTELNAIGNNFNQVVKRLHTLQHFHDIQLWILSNENARQIFMKKVSEIKEKINQINDQWLQS